MWDWKKIGGSLLHGGGIRRRLLMWGLILLGIGRATAVVVGYSYTVRQIKRDAAVLQMEIASEAANRINAFIQRKIERLSDTAAAMSGYRLGSKEQQFLAGLVVKNDTSFTAASVMDGRGMEVLKISDRKAYVRSKFSDQSKSEKFNKAIKGENYISPVYTSDRAQPYVTLAVPLRGPLQDIAGVVSAEAYLEFLWEVIGNIHFSAAGYAYLVDGQGNLIAHKDRSLVLRKMNLEHIQGVQRFLRNPTLPDPTPAHEGQGIMGMPVMSTYAPVRGLGWGVILEEPLDAALADVKTLERDALLALAIGLLIGVLLIGWVSNRITLPIRELHQGAKIIGSGDLDYRVNIKTRDEIEELAEEFNKMAGELKASYSTLEQKVAQRTASLSALYDVTTTVNQSLELDVVLQEVIKKITGIFHFDATRIFIFNADGSELRVRALFETEPGRLTGASVFKRGQGLVGAVAETGEPIIFEDTRSDPRYDELSHFKASRRAGLSFLANFPVSARERCIGVLACNGREPRRLVPEEIGLLTSMANQIGIAVENATLFAALQKRTGELEKANLELQEASRIKSEFMAAMSHELRTPLNVIIGNVALIKDEFYGGITGKQRNTLDKVTRNAGVLLKLINDVLTLTKMEVRKDLETSTLHMEEIISHVQDYVEQLNRNVHVEILWKVEPNLRPITTDVLKLEEILQNLIDNAYKFTPKGTIEIRVRDLEGKNRVEFVVADTGIGIEEKDLDKIFDEFHQLKEAHTGHFSGAGLGLSIVKRYIELIRGDIRVESQPGIGSTFTFSLPYSL